MSIEINHLIVPASDKVASARFLADILGIEAEPAMGHFQPVQVGPVTLAYDDATDIRHMHIAFLVGSTIASAGVACTSTTRTGTSSSS
jgi:hypothetical protein